MICRNQCINRDVEIINQLPYAETLQNANYGATDAAHAPVSRGGRESCQGLPKQCPTSDFRWPAQVSTDQDQIRIGMTDIDYKFSILIYNFKC